MKQNFIAATLVNPIIRIFSYSDKVSSRNIAVHVQIANEGLLDWTPL